MRDKPEFSFIQLSETLASKKNAQVSCTSIADSGNGTKEQAVGTQGAPHNLLEELKLSQRPRLLLWVQ